MKKENKINKIIKRLVLKDLVKNINNVSMQKIKFILDHFDDPIVSCHECGCGMVDTGDKLITCGCGTVLIYREPITTPCVCGCRDGSSCDCSAEANREGLIT